MRLFRSPFRFPPFGGRALLPALAGASLFISGLATAGAATPPLQTAYTSQRVMNAVSVSDDGRVFVSFPYWGGGDTPGPTVAELDHDGSPRPYPDEKWNDWARTHDSDHAFVRVNAIRFGPDGRLWVVDSGEANVGGSPNPPEGAKAKLVVINIATGQVERTISLAAASTPHTYIDDLRFHGSTLFLTDAGDPGLVVVDMKTGQQRRVLEHARSTTDERPMYAEGHLLISNGRPARVHADQLEVSPDGTKLYFQPSSGPMWVAPTAALEDASLSPDALEKQVSFFYDTPTTGGTAIDGDGNLYVSDTNRLRILRITPAGQATTLVADRRLVWADAMWIAHDGSLWIPAVQLNRTATFERDGKSHLHLPVAIYRMDLHLRPVR
ncbi:SMP-30/gluconolactonase/LRE family protein [Novacetimonas pomaceti]|uniref:Gluconolactonase n=1 Tax=Novacetimonas pomaceti TaxID=2021998 RepID=A0A318QC00_9PROT|nr:L-dopachrome tautomerase-related protein [Novacetimonas pomaceti]PYD74898.1 gluconolactonase [Novacetimonas pomaceti]